MIKRDTPLTDDQKEVLHEMMFHIKAMCPCTRQPDKSCAELEAEGKNCGCLGTALGMIGVYIRENGS